MRSVRMRVYFTHAVTVNKSFTALSIGKFSSVHFNIAFFSLPLASNECALCMCCAELYIFFSHHFKWLWALVNLCTRNIQQLSTSNKKNRFQLNRKNKTIHMFENVGYSTARFARCSSLFAPSLLEFINNFCWFHCFFTGCLTIF